MRVVTLNVRNPSFEDGENSWANRRREFYMLLDRLRPNVLCLQEMIDDEVNDLIASVPFHEPIFYHGTPRDDGIEEGEICAVFCFDPHDTPAAGTEWLGETPDVPGSKAPGAACTRTLTWVDFGEWALINTHLDHIGQDARTTGMAQILRRADALGKPCLVVGDFNAEPDETALRLAREAGFIDLAEDTGPTFHGFRQSGPVTEPLTKVLERVDKIKRLADAEQDPVRRAELLRSHAELKNRAFEYEKLAFPESSKIDYILARGSWRCERAWVDRGDYSDHWAVVADVVLPPLGEGQGWG